MYTISLEGQVALVTGGSRGIGKAAAVKFAEAGIKGVTIVSRHIEGVGEETKAELEAMGVEVNYVTGDASEEATARRAIDTTMERWGRLDIVVNNAGLGRRSTVETVTLEDWDQTMAINLRSTILFTQMAVEIMKKQGKGSIVNISSIAGVTGGSTAPDYAAAKAGVIGFTKFAGKTLAPYGIRVNAVAPGTTESKLMRESWAMLPPSAFEAKIASIPMKRLAQPEEIGSAILFLASDMGSYVCSETLCVCDGRYW